MANTIQQLEDLKEWSQNSERYERRLAFRGGQLVQPGPGRPGYAGDTAGFREDIITFKGKELPKGFAVDKANEFGIDRGTVNRIIDEIRPDIKELPYPETKEAKRKRLVVEKRLRKNFLDNAEFIELHKNFDGSDLKFAEFLNENKFTTDRGGDFTESGVYARRERLGLETKTLPQSMSSYKTEAKELGIDIKGLDDQTIQNKVRFKRSGEIRKQKRLTDPDFSARETATRKAWEKENPERVKEFKFKSRVKSYEKFGMIQAVKNPKEELWRGLFEDGKRYKEGRRLKIVGDYGRYVSRERFLNAKILDTKTGEEITFKNLENYINPKNTGKTYAQVIKPFDQKWFVNETPGLRTEINSKLIPNWTAASKDNFFEIQHNAGRFNDPFDVSLSNESLNLKESQVRTKFEKMWNASDNLSDKKKAFKFYKENLPNEILSKPAMVERSRHFGKEIPFEEQLRALKKEGVNLPRGTLKSLRDMGYGKHCKASGGRVGFAEGDAVTGELTCVMDDVKKTRADLKSPDVEVRAKALTKQRKALQLASKIPQIGKILKTGIQMGTAAITKPLKVLGLTAPIGYAIEGIVEGGFYDNARRKGYSHEQAMAETFTPGLAAGRPEGVPWYGGSEKLREQELMGDPKQNPKVAQYVDALKEQDRIYDAIRRKEALKGEPTTTDETLFIPGDLAAASADVQDLARSGAYRRVDRTLKPESMASQAYETAVEQQLGKDLQRKKEYLEKYDPGALEREEKILSRPRQLEKRYEAMEEKYPTYIREQLDEMLEAWGANTPWNLGFESGVTGYDEMAEWLKTHDKYKDMEAGVANMAGGGIAGLSGGKRFGPPPVSGPMPQAGGLSSQFNRVRKLTG